MCERRKQTPVRGEHIPSKSADIWSNHYQRQIRKKEAERKKKKKREKEKGNRDTPKSQILHVSLLEIPYNNTV